MKRTMALSAATALGLFCAAGQAQVVISQVYGGGGNSSATYKNDFIELKNVGTTPVSLNGWSVQYASNAGPVATNSAPNNAWQVTPLTNVTLQPGQYYLIQEYSGAAVGANLPTADVVDSTTRTGNTNGPGINMNATGAKVALVNTTTPLPARATSSDPVPSWSTLPEVVDFVGYGATADHWEGSGRALAPSNQNSISRVNNGCQDTNDNANDFLPNTAAAHNSTNIVPCGASYPDLGVQLSNAGCNPLVGAAYDVTASINNGQSLPAQASTVVVKLPPTLNFVSANTSGVGTASYNPSTRQVTWTAGTIGGGASASMTVSTVVVGEGGANVTATVSTTTPNDPTSNNSAISYNEVLSSAPTLNTILVASASDTTIATPIDENGTARSLSVTNRPYVSQNGEWIVFRGIAGSNPDTNDCIVVGHHALGAWTYSIVAHEGVTTPVAAISDGVIDANTFGNVMGINNSGEYVYTCRLRSPTVDGQGNPASILHWVLVKGTVAGGVSSTIVGANTGFGGGTAGADSPSAPEVAGRHYNIISSSTIQNDGSVSFASSLREGDSATNFAFFKNSGATVLAQKGVTQPGGGGGLTWSAMDDDSSSDGRGLFVSADGSAWLGTGAISSGDTTNDNVVVVNGTIAVREGSPVGSFTDGAGWATFGSQAVPWTQMLPDGSWYIHGYNPATAGFNQGQDWVNRGGVIVAATGGSIFGSNSEHWNDSILQRTFFLEAGAGNDYVVGGLTDRALPANGSDDTSDGVVVYRSGSVLVREGNPVTVVSTDGSHAISTYYLNLINDNRAFIAGGKLYMTATLRNADSECTRNFTGLPSAIVAVDLPTTNPCPADLGVQGGFPGSDGQLDNNDFIAFITYFFASDPHADLGVQGGFVGSDGLYDNNDFIAFITLFFQGCGS